MDQKKRIVIIGAGISGLACAIKIKRQLAFDNFVILEEASEVGGTWRANNYPGCSSDTPMHFYSLSSDLKPDWEGTHGSQRSILQYWIALAKKYDLYPKIVFNVRVTSALWDSEKQHYLIHGQNPLTGVNTSMTADILVSAMGVFPSQNYPDIPGLSTSKADITHSANWESSSTVDGKKVAVIGNAASAIQLLPEIARSPDTQVTQFCRTPNWILPPIRSQFSSAWKWLFRYVPFLMRLYRIKLFIDAEFRYLVFTSRIVRWIATKVTRQYMLKSTPERYHSKIIPEYPMGCKRVLFDAGYLDALHRPNVELIWDEIAKVTENAIVMKTGDTIPVDVIILATGFNSNYFPIDLRGRGGQTIQSYYDAHGAPRAYLGSSLPGFPNFYMLVGPNTFAGHTSILYGAELEIDYCLSLMRPIIEGQLTTVEVTPVATDAYNERIHSLMARSVFLHCHSWYRKGGDGINSTIFPGGQILRWWWLRKPNWDHFIVSHSDGSGWPRQRGRVPVGSVLGLVSLTMAVIAAGYLGSFAGLLPLPSRPFPTLF